MVEVAKLWATVGADTRDAETGFARIGTSIGGFASASTVALAAAGAGIVAAGGAAINAAATFEQTMSGVKAVSGATNDEMKALSGLALQLGKDTSFSASEAASGIEELVKGGLSIPDVMNGAARSMLDLAAAGGVDLPTAATIAANALAQFGLKGTDMAHVADLIAGAANASALDVNQFKFSLQAAGAVASTVGFTFDDLATGIAVMGKAGIVGSDAGTSLKTMMLNLQPSTAKATKLMRELGIITEQGANRFFDASGKVRSMAQVAEVLQGATSKLTSAQRLQALETIFGSDAIRAAAVLAREGAEGFGEMAASMGKVTAQQVGMERLNNLKGDFDQFMGSVETAAITFGLAFQPALRGAVQWGTSFVNSLIPWAERVGPQVIAAIEGASTAVRNLIASGGDLQKFAADIKAAFGLDLSGAVGPLTTVRDTLTAIVTGIGQVATAAVEGFGAGGLGGAISGALGALEGIAGRLLGWVAEQAPKVVQQVAAWADAFGGWIAPFVASLPGRLEAVRAAVWGFVAENAPRLAAQLGSWAAAFVDWLRPAVLAIPGKLLELRDAAWAFVTAHAPGWVTKLGEWGATLLGWVTPVVAAIPGKLDEFKNAAWAWISTTAPLVLEKLGEWGGSFLGWVGPVVVSIPDRLGEVKDAVWGFVTENAPRLLAKLGEWKDAALDWIGPVVTAIPAKLGEVAGAVWLFISTNARPLLDKLGEWKDAFIAWVGPLLADLPKKLGELKDAVVGWVTDTLIPASEAAFARYEPVVRKGLLETMTKIRDELRPVWADIAKYLEDFAPTGERIERLFATIGRTFETILLPLTERVLDFFARLFKSAENGETPLKNIAFWVNGITGAWEGQLRLAGGVLDFFVKLEERLRPVTDLLARLAPAGQLTPALAAWLGGGATGGGQGAGGGGGGASLPAGWSRTNPQGQNAHEAQGLDPERYAWTGNGWALWRDRGGRGVPGQQYAIGVPEIYQPDRPGRFIPLGGAQLGAQTVVVPVSIGGERITTVVARANRAYAGRGGRA